MIKFTNLAIVNIDTFNNVVIICDCSIREYCTILAI